MKALSIIAIIISTLFFLWSLLALTSNGSISMEEASPFIVLYALFSLAIPIVALVSTNKLRRQIKELTKN